MQKYRPAKSYASWIALNFEVLESNLGSIDTNHSVIDISLPLLAKVWEHLEDAILRAGCQCCASNKPSELLRVPARFERIILPGFQPNELGYAIEGLIPVLSSYSEILALSNMAQTNGCRAEFMLRVRTLDEAFGTGDFGHHDVLQKVSSLPMIDLVGAYLDFNPDPRQLKTLVRDLRGVSSRKEPLLLQEYGLPRVTGVNNLVSFELVGLNANELPIAFEAGFWAFPIEKRGRNTIFRADLGKVNGLPADFPAMIGEFKASIVEVRLNHTILAVENFDCPAQAPFKGFFIGNAILNPVPKQSWEGDNLQNLLLHQGEQPVYLIKGSSVTEILPFKAFSL